MHSAAELGRGERGLGFGQRDGLPFDLGELDLQQAPLDADALAALALALVEGEHLGIDVAQLEADDDRLLRDNVGLQQLDDCLGLAAADAAIELGVIDLADGTPQGRDGAGQKGLAVLRLHPADTVEIADTFDMQVKKRGRDFSGHEGLLEHENGETMPRAGDGTPRRDETTDDYLRTLRPPAPRRSGRF